MSVQFSVGDRVSLTEPHRITGLGTVVKIGKRGRVTVLWDCEHKGFSHSHFCPGRLKIEKKVKP